MDPKFGVSVIHLKKGEISNPQGCQLIHKKSRSNSGNPFIPAVRNKTRDVTNQKNQRKKVYL